MANSQIDIYEIGEALPIAVVGEPSDLSESDQKTIRSMIGSDTRNFMGTLALTWLLIILAITVAVHLNSMLANVAVICFIATRQNVLGLLTHEQVHSLGLRSQLGDAITNAFCAFPILITLQGYRHIHLTHHRKYFTELDPDYRRKQGKQWTFPQSTQAFLSTLFCDLIGLSLVSTIRGKKPDKAMDKKGQKPNIVFHLGYYGAIALALTLTNTWTYFLLYWIVPIATVLQVIVRWGAVSEHRYNLVNPSIQESTPLIQPRWWEALVMPNLNFSLHVYHHWYPTIPFNKLPLVHNIFVDSGLVNSEHVFDGYIDYFLFLVAKGRHKIEKTIEQQPDMHTLTPS